MTRSCSKHTLRNRIPLEWTFSSPSLPSVPFHSSESLPTPELKWSKRIILSSLGTYDRTWSSLKQNSTFVLSTVSRVRVGDCCMLSAGQLKVKGHEMHGSLGRLSWAHRERGCTPPPVPGSVDSCSQDAGCVWAGVLGGRGE